MTQHVRFGEGLSFEVEPQTFHVPGGKEPDPNWRYVDPTGHLHAWVDGKLPSCKWVVDEPAFDGGVDSDGFDIYTPERGHWECGSCRKMRGPKRPREEARTVIPGYRKVGEKHLPAGDPIVTAIVMTFEERGGGSITTRTVRLTVAQMRAAMDEARLAVARLADEDPSLVLNTEMRTG